MTFWLRCAGGRFDVLVSNPPYIPRGEIPCLQREVRDWEPALALDGGIDGMDFYRRIVRDGVRHLRDGGLMAVEIGADLSGGVSELFRAHAELHRVRIMSDYSGGPRVVAAERAHVGAGFKTRPWPIRREDGGRRTWGLRHIRGQRFWTASSFKGGTVLEGTVALGGSKNAALPVIISSLLTADECAYARVPALRDVSTTLRLLSRLGVTIEKGRDGRRTPGAHRGQDP